MMNNKRFGFLSQRRTAAPVAAIVAGAAVLVVAIAVRIPWNTTPVEAPVIDGKEAYHVIVAGGEPEGVAAALAAARNGAKTLLVEQGDALGGLMTLGMLNVLDMNYSGHNLLTRGIFNEFYKALGNSFDVEEAKGWFLRKCNDEPNLTVMLNTQIIGPVMDGNAIAGVEIWRPEQPVAETVRSLAVIDATADGDIAASAGAPYTWGGEDHGAHWRQQGVTLVFEVSGVDWDAVTGYLKNDGNSDSDADEIRAWGYGAEAKGYTPVDGNMRFRGPNIARQRNGNVLLNALVIFGVEALDPVSYAEGIERGRREIPHIVQFMRENFIGFKNAAFVGHAPRLYVRQTRHFIGEYRLTITDVLENRDHWDRIGHGKYPVDIQPTGPGDSGNIIGFPEIYSIPFRCLVPKEIDRLLIAGRSASYDSLPHGSARVIPIGMVAGEACGTAAAYSTRNGISFRDMAYDKDALLWLQNTLRRQGAYLVEYEPPAVAVMDHWAYPGLAVMRELGLAASGYANDYRLDDEIANRWALQNRVNHIMRVVHEGTENRGSFQIPARQIDLQTDDITVGVVLQAAAECASLGDRDWVGTFVAVPGGTIEPKVFADAFDAKYYLTSRGVLGPGSLIYFHDLEAAATMGQLISVLGALYTVLME